MRRAEDELIDPQVGAELDAIDAVLAGDPVDPRHAELAELALLLVADRPEPSPQFASELDTRVQRRFAGEPGDAAAGGSASGWAGLRNLFVPLAGLATAGVAAIIAVAVLQPGSGTSNPPALTALSRPYRTSTSASSTAAGRAKRAPGPVYGAPTNSATSSAPNSPTDLAGASSASSAASSAAAVLVGLPVAWAGPQRPQDHPVRGARSIDAGPRFGSRVSGGVQRRGAGERGSQQLPGHLELGRLGGVPAERSELLPRHDDGCPLRPPLRNGQLPHRQHPGRQRPVPPRPARAGRRPGAPDLAAQTAGQRHHPV